MKSLEDGARDWVPVVSNCSVGLFNFGDDFDQGVIGFSFDLSFEFWPSLVSIAPMQKWLLD